MDSAFFFKQEEWIEQSLPEFMDADSMVLMADNEKDLQGLIRLL